MLVAAATTAVLLVVAVLWLRLRIVVRLSWVGRRFWVNVVIVPPLAGRWWQWRMSTRFYAGAKSRGLPARQLINLLPPWLQRTVRAATGLWNLYCLVRTGRKASVPDRRVWAAAGVIAGRGRIATLRLLVVNGDADAAVAAIRSGMWWAAVGTAFAVIGLVKHPPQRLSVRICPRYDRPVNRGRLHCIFTISIVDIIVAAWRGMRQRRTGSERPSDPAPDEDGDGKHQGNG